MLLLGVYSVEVAAAPGRVLPDEDMLPESSPSYRNSSVELRM
jgi:hypothetical protein